MKDKKEKPKYNMWQNSAWMIVKTWKEKEKKILIISVLFAAFALATNLAELYVVPSILGIVEHQASLGELAKTILFFTVSLLICRAGTAYIERNMDIACLGLRVKILSWIAKKKLTTAYPNVTDNDFSISVAKAEQALQYDEMSMQRIIFTLVLLLQNLIGFVLYLMLLTAVHPMLFALIFVTSAVSYILTIYASRYLRDRRKDSAYYGKRMWYIGNKAKETDIAKDVRLFGLQSWLEELNQKAMCAHEAYFSKIYLRFFIARVVDLILTFLRNGVAYAYLIGLVLYGKLTVSEFLLYFTAINGFAAWVTGILNQLVTLHRQSIDITALREVLEFSEPFLFEQGEPFHPDCNKKYELKLENVTFRYPHTDKEILKKIDLTIHPGEKIAVVGLNGAGKTTLVKLICGFLDPTEGRVLLDGKDIREYNRLEYYKLFSAVFQDFMVLPATIAANVAQSEENIDIDLVKACIEKAGLKAKVESEPKTYDTRLNREVYQDAIMLSGGETQRLMLARALYRDALFIILDEPTAALDPIAEAEMYQKYHEMTMGKSSVYISHRLASTRFCDRILFIEDGVIAEESTHDILIQKGGKYAKLFAVQSQYYKTGGGENDEK